MLALLKSRWVLLTIVLPLAVWSLDRLGSAIESRRGESNATRLLHWPRAARRTAA
jgi:hypothetical protein